MFRLLLAVCCTAILATTYAAEPLPAGTAAPAFTLPDATGAQVPLASYAGKVVVLEWVNFDCPFVKKHYASGNLPTLQKEWTGKGVIWLSVCSSAPGKQGYFTGEALTARIASEKAAPTHYLIDADGAVGKTYGAATTPQLVVIDAGGVVRYHGAIDSIRSTRIDDVAKATSHIREALAAVTNGQAVTTSQTKPYGCSVKYAD